MLVRFFATISLVVVSASIGARVYAQEPADAGSAQADGGQPAEATPDPPDLQVREVPAAEPAPASEPDFLDEVPAVAAQPEAPAEHVEEMVVTGSRVRRKDLTGSAPIAVISREQLLASGRPNIGEFLQTMPEQSNALGRGTNNGGDGSILVNLRGLGAQSTLVLLNGRRLAPGGTGADSSPDLSAIPTQVIVRQLLQQAHLQADARARAADLGIRARVEVGDTFQIGAQRLNGKPRKTSPRKLRCDGR